MTGNTHRTEFCIDKMYDPTGPSGRRGPGRVPRLRDAAARAHVGRADAADARRRRRVLAAPRTSAGWSAGAPACTTTSCCRTTSSRISPTRWRSSRSSACRSTAAWFDPHFEFRFPQIGEIAVRGIGVELRHALEPWHVLGEEHGRRRHRALRGQLGRAGAGAGDRLGGRALRAGLQRRRRCRWRRPSAAGEYVAGVRFKAWDPPSALHPTIRAQAPLVFDVYDRWTGRSLGGLTHHVAHPGGRNYETFPVNANEAEARRRARFFPIGHTPGPMAEPRRRVGRASAHARPARGGVMDSLAIPGLAPGTAHSLPVHPLRPARRAAEDLCSGRAAR